MSKMIENRPELRNLENPDTKFFIIQNQKNSKIQNFENTAKINYYAQFGPPATTPKVLAVIPGVIPALPGVFAAQGRIWCKIGVFLRDFMILGDFFFEKFAHRHHNIVPLAAGSQPRQHQPSPPSSSSRLGGSIQLHRTQITSRISKYS